MLVIEKSGEEGSDWLTPSMGGINAAGRIYILCNVYIMYVVLYIYI